MGRGLGRLGAAVLVAACFAANQADAVTKVTCGKASWYQLTGRTASGERADPDAMVAAHPTLPLGTHVYVTNLRNSRSVVVRIYDRGPYVGARIIDLSRGAAKVLGFINRGVATVRVAVMGKDGLAPFGACP
jgi:rare lipoprotein A